LVTHGWSHTIQSSYTSQFIKKPPQFHIGSVIDLYLIVWTDYAGYNIPVDIAFIIENPWAIATSSSHIIILICKKIFFFKITTVIQTIKYRSITEPMWNCGGFFMNWLVYDDWIVCDQPWVTNDAKALYYPILSSISV
jgi:hypothetical protein